MVGATSDTEKNNSNGTENGDKKHNDVEVVDLDEDVKAAPSPVNVEDSDSSSNILVIDIDEEEEKKQIINEAEKQPAKAAAKRKRSESGENGPPQPAKKSSRRSSSASVKKFDQVENELEAMFAGLEGEEIKEEIKEEVKTEIKIEPKEKIPKTEPKEKPSSSKPKVEKKKQQPKVEKEAKTAKKPRRKSTEKKQKETVKNDSDSKLNEQERLLEKYKGPFVHVQGDLQNIRWTNTINNITDSLDNNEEPKIDIDQVARVTGFGYTLTTLSHKYDPRNVDESWICVFCRKPSHYGGLGDLFGPYFIPNTQWKSLNMPSPAKQQSKSDLASSFILGGSDQAGAKAKKRQKRKSGGPLESPKKDAKTSGGDQSEVWFHEDCICWMPQIRLIGSQILGLSEAIRVSQKAVCTKCNYRGATLACGQMRCREMAHFPCGQDLMWDIDDESFVSKCQQHLQQQS